VKVNCFDSGPQLSDRNFIVIASLPFTVRYTKYYNIVLTFLVEHGISPGPPNSLRLIVSQILSYLLYIVSFNFLRQTVQKGPFFRFQN